MKHPIQPLLKVNGVLRFKENAIVSCLYEVGKRNAFGLNEIACKDFSKNDRQQFAQLIGYSLAGYGELSYVDADAFAVAEAMKSEGKSEDKSRIDHLEKELAAVRKALREPMARLFGIHPDDLNIPE